MRLLVAPAVVASTIGVFGTGVLLVVMHPQRGIVLGLHKASFVIWFGAMSLHVLGHVLNVPGLARADLGLTELAALEDEAVKARLVELRGVGEWTADWFLARHLARPRAWPAGDLALRKAVAHFYGDADVRAVGERLDPFQNLSAHYLLAGLYAGVGS